MKKILLCCFVLILAMQNAFATEYKDFQQIKNEIEIAYNSRQYNKVLKIIKNVREDNNMELTNEDKQYLSNKVKSSKENLDEINFLKKFKIETDDFTGCTKYTTKYNLGNMIIPTLIVDKQNTKLILYFEFIYNGQNWLFIDHLIVKYGNEILAQTLNVPYLQKSGQNVYCSYGICKYYENKTIDATKDIDQWKDIAISGGTIRAYGKYEYKDFPIYTTSQESIKNILDLYEYLKMKNNKEL